MSLTPRVDRLTENYVINGNFDYWQRGSAASSTTSYVADRWRHSALVANTQCTTERSSDVPFGDGYSSLITCTSTVAEASGTLRGYIHILEGQMMQQLVGKKIAVTFYTKANHDATYSAGVITGPTIEDSYFKSISVQNGVWTRHDIIIDLTGHDAPNTSAAGMTFLIELIASSDRYATPETWQTNTPARRGISGQDNFFDTIGNEIQLAKVMIYEIENDTQLVADNLYIRSGRTLADELNLCRRYYQRDFRWITGVCDLATRVRLLAKFPIQMRAAPSITMGSNTDLYDIMGYDGSVNGSGSVTGSTTTDNISFSHNIAETEAVGRPVALKHDRLELDAEL